jgi:hypothetical protein
MKCRWCGQTNEKRNKFCGECGKPMQEERRRAERRIIAWEPQQCRSCGSVNGAASRFCGMCGTVLQAERRRADRRIVGSAAASAAAANAIRTPAAEPANGLDDSSRAATSYLGAPPPSSQKPRGEWVRSSGSSFLGLEDEPPANSDYLFLDEEPKSRSGLRFLLALLILAAVGYLIFKNWDSPTFAAALSQLRKHTQVASSTEPKPQPSNAEQPSISTDETAASADAAKQSSPSAAPDPGKPDSTQSPAAATTPQPAAKPRDDAKPKKDDESATPATDDQADDNSTDPSDPADKSSKDSNAPTISAKSSTLKTTAPGQELYERGQAYLSGHGAPQSCDQGVVYTRAAAQQGNPKAAVQMGALYATGHCVSQDRVQAYNWFNEALRNDPSNEYVERSRATLWAQMTSEERQRASRQ